MVETNIEVIYLGCQCGHGGKAWHYNVYGKCNYGKCACNYLKPSEAMIKFSEENIQTLSAKQFIDFYNKNNHRLIYQ